MAYWNMLAPRHASGMVPDRLRLFEELSRHLHLQDKAFFYSAFFVEEIL
jgi:S-adenosylmethionine-diacylglycerol 3-amino-3-carboxypropyl transferase